MSRRTLRTVAGVFFLLTGAFLAMSAIDLLYLDDALILITIGHLNAGLPFEEVRVALEALASGAPVKSITRLQMLSLIVSAGIFFYLGLYGLARRNKKEGYRLLLTREYWLTWKLRPGDVDDIPHAPATPPLPVDPKEWALRRRQIKG